MTEDYNPQKHEFGTPAATAWAKSLTPGQGDAKKEPKEKKKLKSFTEHMDAPVR